ncbi:hypothetical protein EAY15_07700 [Vibrio anguillarum]|nr:hypothetical protein CEQ50_16970 [Vibrio anguillarum]ATC59538.1 hypothetical protein CMV05_19000 [Vibrio anguillarum]MBF4252303.1 hypothetical protein [Vibrio anguillarum]MBF4387220.1 hypothetical protein [Vibrio anguillarum]MBF4403206.1 hypothetical protein [Vibrio anguillarum]
MSIFTLKFLVNSNRKTGKILCLPQSVLSVGALLVLRAQSVERASLSSILHLLKVLLVKFS